MRRLIATGELDRKTGIGWQHNASRETRLQRIADLQRAAGNSAVAQLLGLASSGSKAFSLQAADASAHADAGTPAPQTTDDSAITSLDLESDVADAARELKSQCPTVRFTSGRRSLEEDARAVAHNIVGNRNYMDIFANSSSKTTIKTYVDAHKDADEDELTKGIAELMGKMTATQRSWIAPHQSGRAFDVGAGSCSKETIQSALAVKPLDEGNHIHVQFTSTWKKPAGK